MRPRGGRVGAPAAAARILRSVTEVSGYQHKALVFIGLRGKTEQAVADEYGSRQPLEIAELIEAGLVREDMVDGDETQSPGATGQGSVGVYYLTRTGAEALGLDPDQIDVA
jgi:hypothetical protein